MKAQFFSLLLSAILLATNPLWAMDSAEPDNEKRVTPGALFNMKDHECPSCHPTLRFSNINEIEGKGYLCVLPDDALVKIISALPLEDMINNVSLVSKAMHNLCQHPSIWLNLDGDNEEKLCPKWYTKLVFFLKHTPEPE